MTTGLEQPTTPPGAVAEAARGLSGLAGVLWAARPAAELLETLHQLEGLRSLVAGLQARLLVEVDAAGVAKAQLGWSSTAAWWTHAAGLRRGAGKQVLRTAEALTGPLAATLAGLEAGRVSPEQAGVIAAAVDSLPGSPVLRARAEQALLAEADRLDATDLATAARHLAEVADPDGADRKAERDLDRAERAAHTGRRLTIIDDGAGGVRVSGRGSVEDAAKLRAALLPLTSPAGDLDEAGQPVPDPRDHPARLWDALIGLADHALDCRGPLPTSHGARPRVGVTLDYHWLAHHPDQNTPRPNHPRPGHPDPNTGPNHPHNSHPRPSHPDQSTPGPGHPDQSTPGPTGAGSPAGPAPGGAAPTGSGDHWFAGRPGNDPAPPAARAGRTDDGLTVSAATIRRWACDADILPVVLGRHSEVLDVGRRHRLVTPALWQALVVRDAGCTFPSCTRPPIMCQAHHILHWADGGPTSLDNLVLLCGHHHRHLHHTPWQVTLNPTDHRPDFTPPPRHPGHIPEPIRHRPRRE